MAYLLSSHIRSMGHTPIVFSKLPATMTDWGVQVESDVDDFVEAADVVVFGGGGLLIPRPHLGGDRGDFNADLGGVLRKAGTKNTPLYGISIGGAGEPLYKIVPEERQLLIRSLRYVTLRNSEDLQLLEQAGVEGEFQDDLVWTTAAVYPLERPPQRGRRRVGINFYLGRSRRFLVLQKIIELIVRARSDIDFVFLDNHPGRDGEFKAYSPARLPANCSRKTLVDIEDACREVASLDVLFTTRLHVGVMAMCYGVLTVAYAGQKKTRLLYNRISRGEFFWPSNEVVKFLKVFLIPGGLDRLIGAAQEPIDTTVFDSAAQHYTRLEILLSDKEPAFWEKKIEQMSSGAGGNNS